MESQFTEEVINKHNNINKRLNNREDGLPIKKGIHYSCATGCPGNKDEMAGGSFTTPRGSREQCKEKMNKEKEFPSFNTLSQSGNCGTQGQSKTWKAVFPARSFAAKLLAPHHPAGALPVGGDLRGWLETANQLPSSGDLGTWGATPTPE